jgi:ribosomal protein L12E/L44/L45/RPP1/RPP2
MLYASSRRAILVIAEELGVRVDTKIETSEVDELTLKYLMKQVHGVEEVLEENKKKVFARPKGPQKRVQKTASSGDSGTE